MPRQSHRYSHRRWTSKVPLCKARRPLERILFCEIALYYFYFLLYIVPSSLPIFVLLYVYLNQFPFLLLVCMIFSIDHSEYILSYYCTVIPKRFKIPPFPSIRPLPICVQLTSCFIFLFYQIYLYFTLF